MKSFMYPHLGSTECWQKGGRNVVGPLSKNNQDALHLFRNRNKLLTALREHSLRDPEEQSRSVIFQYCCDILADSFNCHFIWAGDIDAQKCCLIPLAASPPATPLHYSKQHQLAALLIEKFSCELTSFNEPLYLHFDDNRDDKSVYWPPYCIVCPVGYQQHKYGFVAIHCDIDFNICTFQTEFFSHLIDDIALAIYSQNTALKLKIERDFNKEIVDTIQALMVTIRPCGTILSFNRRAEQVTGYEESEILEKYWVDVMTTPDNRLKFQKKFSETLKGATSNINFMAPLLTKSGIERYISWHGSIRHNIEKGTVGLVMLGIDETESLFAGQQLNMFTARWEKIFIAIQDPALVVSNDNTIIEANPATCAAAKKLRHQVIGKKVCDILHGGHGDGLQCPLEEFIGYQQTRISETELHGLNGSYMLTVSPLIEENGEINTTLLVARNLTEEEVLRAESIRAAQLAAIGELASGVAHEINNPINGIINYARIILDDPGDREAADNLLNIITEGKRIAAIVSNLLDFARGREDTPIEATIDEIISSSMQLVAHLLKKDGISCSVEIAEDLPPLYCNQRQLQQVVLNIISNARYALNKRYSTPSPEKKLLVQAKLKSIEDKPCIALTITDFGTGISREIRDRLFDPFFSTKPKGEGTGLGLSISHGLISDHGGKIRVRSRLGQWSRFTIELPVGRLKPPEQEVSNQRC
jgi:PAS domain S-box-containing protein